MLHGWLGILMNVYTGAAMIKIKIKNISITQESFLVCISNQFLSRAKHFSDFYHHILFILELLGKEFQSKVEPGGYKMENLMHVPSEKQNVRTERLISHKCPSHRKLAMLEFS